MKRIQGFGWSLLSIEVGDSVLDCSVFIAEIGVPPAEERDEGERENEGEWEERFDPVKVVEGLAKLTGEGGSG